MDNSIATPHWEACETCSHYKDDGCDMSWFELEAIGDSIICHDHSVKTETKQIRREAGIPYDESFTE